MHDQPTIRISIMDKKRALDLPPHVRHSLERLAAVNAKNQPLRLRAQLILDWADGLTGQQSAELRQTSRRTVSKWRCRFRSGGLAALSDLPRPGAPRTIPDDKIDELQRLRRLPPPHGKPRWTTRMLAHHIGLSQSTIVRLDRELRRQREGSQAVGGREGEKVKSEDPWGRRSSVATIPHGTR